MSEQSQDQYKTPAEISEQAGITEEEVLRRLETGHWPTVALGEWLNDDGECVLFDYTLVSPEVVRRIIAQTHEQIEYKTSHKTVVIQAKKELIRVLTGLDFTPELFGANAKRQASLIVGNAASLAAVPPELQPAANVVATRHKLRTNSLDAPIEKAIIQAGNLSTASVYLKLKWLALEEEAPFTGQLDGNALCYTKDDNKPDKLTKNALDHRLRLRRKRE